MKPLNILWYFKNVRIDISKSCRVSDGYELHYNILEIRIQGFSAACMCLCLKKSIGSSHCLK
eukprot:c54312_g1_i1 orf=435-620(+)